MKILLVDDEPIVLQGVSTIIRQFGNPNWKVVGQCSSTEEALVQIDRLRPEVVMTDIRMSGLSGLELTERIKEKNKDTVVILLTGYADFDFARQALKLGAFEYLLKPTQYADILDCLKKAEAHLQKMKEKEFLFESLQDSRIAAREKFLMDLMKGIYSVGQNLEKLSEYYHLDSPYYLVLSLKHIQQQNLFGKDSKDKNMQDYAIKNIAAEILSECGKVFTVSDTVDHFWAVLLLKEYDMDSVSRVVQLLINKAEEAIGVRVRIGVSEPCTRLDDLCVSYGQAGHCLQLCEQNNWFSAFGDQLHYTHPEKNYSDNILKAISYVQNHYQESISLKDVAEYVYLNIWYFSDLFKREVGKSFTDYVTELRISHAKELLKDKKKKLYQISYSIGINEPAYFSQLFKKVTGMSPKEYRNSL